MTKASDALLAALRAHPPAKAAMLATLVGVTQPTISRALKLLGDQIVSRGAASRSRYAARRAIRGRSASFPLYRIDPKGDGNYFGEIDCVYPEGTAVALRESLPWPVDGEMRDGWYDGLPYWLSDMRPQGFLGRNFARYHARALQVPEDPSDWSDDDVLYALATTGFDQPGDLIVGDAAYELHLEHALTAEKELLQPNELSEAYPRLAREMLERGVAGSSAGGEFPKFTASRHADGKIVHVIVKFSGAGDSPAEVRWSDLLICEHLALECLREHLGIAAALSQIYQYDGRTFLEVERFDRHGLLGRSAMCTLESINAALVGSTETRWPTLADSLVRAGFTDPQQASAIQRLWWFGRLIANTDMHQGNLSFRPGLRVAEAYDMLPMEYAPLRGGELPQIKFEPPQPSPRERDAWNDSSVAARSFWHRVAHDQRITGPFRQTARQNSRALEKTQDHFGAKTDVQT
jgi:hypothetical protein